MNIWNFHKWIKILIYPACIWIMLPFCKKWSWNSFHIFSQDFILFYKNIVKWIVSRNYLRLFHCNESSRIVISLICCCLFGCWYCHSGSFWTKNVQQKCILVFSRLAVFLTNFDVFLNFHQIWKIVKIGAQSLTSLEADLC